MSATDDAPERSRLGRAIDGRKRSLPTWGLCTRCGALEAELVKQTGTRDFSHIGEHHAYPTGYGCELCS